MLWCGVGGVVVYGVMWCGMGGVVGCGVLLYGMVWCGVVLSSVV